MRFNPITNSPNTSSRIETEYLRHILKALILLALLFVVAGLAVFVTRAQNPNCVDLKKRVDDAARAYQMALTQSQSIDRNYTSYQSAVTRLRGELVANDRRKEQTARDISEAQRDRSRCDGGPGTFAINDCANISHRIDTAEKRLAYFRANENKLYADLSENQQKLSLAKAILREANANLTTAQQDLDDANKAYASAGCSGERAVNR
jgi:chromosome segregation ATPase